MEARHRESTGEKEPDQDSDEYGEETREAIPVPPPAPKVIVKHLSTVLMARMHDSEKGYPECSYCQGKRNTYTGEVEEGCNYHKLGFSSSKFRYDDYELLLNEGFTRCGNYFYSRNMLKSCCEAYQYRVDAAQFQPSKSQKKTIKRFHNYLTYGDIKGPKNSKPDSDEKERGEDVEMKEGPTQIQESPVSSITSALKAGLEVKFNLAAMTQVVERHRVTLNAKLQCISSNLSLVASKHFKEQEFNDQQIHAMASFAATSSLSDVQLEVKLEKGFLNFYHPTFNNLKGEAKKEAPSLKVKLKAKEDVKVEEDPMPKPQPGPNHYKNYLIEYHPMDTPDGVQPKHTYTIELHRAMFTEELFELYIRYEKAVHKKDRERDNLKRFLCNSPVYDADKDLIIKESPSLENCQSVDETFREFKDEGLFPGHGTFHMYHRIDGKLVAVSVIDILKHTLVSCYCIYDPDLSFLCLGVIAAIREFEYLRLLKQSYLPTLKYYQLGEMVISCPKVNYKLNYKPGLVICPRTKKVIPVDEKCLEQIKMIASLPLAEKKALPYIQLDEYKGEGPTERELLAKILKPKLKLFPFLFEDTKWLTVSNLNEKGSASVAAILEEIILECGMEVFRKLFFELKFPPKPPTVAGATEAKEDPGESKEESTEQESQKAAEEKEPEVD